MSENSSPRVELPKIDPDSLVLRGRPRRVVRFKRHVVIGVAAIVCIAVFGATWLALNAPTLRRHLGDQELFSTERKATPDGLASLPGSYDQIKKPPQLGAPLPGDLGPPVVREERNLGLRPNPEEDAARTERMRLAQQARQAREAGVFFQNLARRPRGRKQCAANRNAGKRPGQAPGFGDEGRGHRQRPPQSRSGEGPELPAAQARLPGPEGRSRHL